MSLKTSWQILFCPYTKSELGLMVIFQNAQPNPDGKINLYFDIEDYRKFVSELEEMLRLRLNLHFPNDVELTEEQKEAIKKRGYPYGE